MFHDDNNLIKDHEGNKVYDEIIIKKVISHNKTVHCQTFLWYMNHAV